MSLKKVTTNVTYRVPAWEYCNLNSHKIGQPSTERCRFCVKEKGHYRCALYNEVLGTENGAFVVKTRSCERAVAGFRSIVEDVVHKPEPTPEPIVDPKRLMKTTIKMYVDTKKKLLAQGYPEPLADQIAQEFVLGGR